MKRGIIISLILINIGVSLVGCKEVVESENNGNVNTEQSTIELSEEEKTIIEAKRLLESGSYEEARRYIETIIFPNGSNYSQEQQNEVNKIIAEISEVYVPPILNLTQEEAVSLVLNHDDVVYYNFTGGESISDIVPIVSSFNLGDKFGYKIYVEIPDDWFPTVIGTYFVDSATGDIYKNNKEDRFELLK